MDSQFLSCVEGTVKRKKSFPGREVVKPAPPLENRIRQTSDTVKKEKSPPVRTEGVLAGIAIIKERDSQPLM